jgi:CRP-like cAMP-binding protein
MSARTAEVTPIRAPAQDGKTVCLPDVLPVVFDPLAGEDKAIAQRTCIAETVSLPVGPWEAPHDPRRHAEDLGFVVIEGLLTRIVGVEERDFSELLGEGDLIRPWDAWDYESSVHPQTRWQVLAPTRLAILDRRIALAVGHWPAVMSNLMGRTMQRARSLAFLLAACHITRVELRLLVILWHYADRWGRVTPDGIALTLPLTHALLAEIVGARRPTVTTALSKLEESGLLTREPRHRWLLRGDPPAELHRIASQVSG